MLNKISDISITGHSMIVAAFEHFSKTRKEPIRFFQLFKPLQLSFEIISMNLKIRCLTLINSLISNTEEIALRNEMRNELLQMDLQEVFDVFQLNGYVLTFERE